MMLISSNDVIIIISVDFEANKNRDGVGDAVISFCIQYLVNMKFRIL